MTCAHCHHDVDDHRENVGCTVWDCGCATDFGPDRPDA